MSRADEERYREVLEKIQSACYLLSAPQIKNMVDLALNPPQEMEEVALTRFECLTCGFIEKPELGITSPNKCCRTDERTTLAGHHLRPVRQKVTRREEITIDDNAHWRSVHMDSEIPENTLLGHFFYEWEEEQP